MLSLPSLASTSDTKYFPGRRRRKAFLRETRSTKASVLHALTRAFPHVAMPAIIGQHRTMQGWVEKYLQPLLSAAIASPEKRIYGHFLQTATATGRLSMSEPNLQTIPKPIAFTLGNTEHSIRPRKAFVASHNCVLLSADYSQIEVRLLAHFSEDPALLSAFRSGGDVFKRLSSAVTGKPIEDVTPSERAQAKTLCYGMVYGKGVASIAEDLEITEAEAEGVLSSFRACYPVAMTFISEYCLQSAKCGFVETLAGRRRWLPHINSQNPRAKSASNRQAINTLCQGSAADIIKVAMIRIFTRVQHEEGVLQSRMLLQIHDELLFDVPQGKERALGCVVREEMTRALSAQLRVELPVVLRVGPNWDELTALS